MEWIKIYNVHFVDRNGVLIRSWKPSKIRGIFYEDLLMRSDLTSIIPAFESVFKNHRPRFVTYYAQDCPYIALLKKIPGHRDIVIVHETMDKFGMKRRKNLIQMLKKSADDLYYQLLAS